MKSKDLLKELIKNNSEFKKEYENINYPLDSSWNEIKKTEFSKKSLSEILNIVDYKRSCGVTIYPDADKVLAAFNMTPLNRVKVVILGQDPYHEPSQANGMSFSVNKNTPLPPSLKNIFKELKNDIGGNLRTNGDLSDWAEQGVLLLNTSLTVCEHLPNSMTELWSDFTDNVIRLINSKESPVIFVLWGKEAQKKRCLITNPHHSVIESAHPSPFSAHKGFFGSKPFSRINKILKETNQDEINWLGNKERK